MLPIFVNFFTLFDFGYDEIFGTEKKKKKVSYEVIIHA